MTSAQIYALFINPLLMLAWVGAFGFILMRKHARNAKRVAEAKAAHSASNVAAPSTPMSHPAPSREQSFAK